MSKFVIKKGKRMGMSDLAMNGNLIINIQRALKKLKEKEDER